MNIESLETFVLLSENKNFTKTAQVQYLVQSTVSNRINELERYVGKALFIRDNKNVKLTKAGEAFLPYARRILMLKKDAVIKARSAETYKDRLSVGLEDSIYKGIISPVIKEYFLRFPDIAVKLKINHSDELVRLLDDGILDIGFIYTKPKIAKFEVFDFVKDEIVLVTSPKNKIIEPKIMCSDICNFPILYADLGEEFFNWLSRIYNGSPLFRFSSDEIESTIDFVRSGLGCAFVYKSYVKNEIQNGKLIQIKLDGSLPPSRHMYMLVNKEKTEKLSIKSWIKMVQMFIN